jgi:4-hydroxymandelate oxidase
MDGGGTQPDGGASSQWDPQALERRARRLLDPRVFDYYAAGSGREITTGEAAAAWRTFRLLPRVLHDVSAVDTGLELAGSRLASPVLVAPSALQAMAHPRGELATAAGAREAAGLLVLSSRASREIEQVAREAGPWWFQVYCLRDREATDRQVGRAAAAGARALVLTVDVPYVAAKPRLSRPLPLAEDEQTARRHAPGLRDPSFEQDPSLGPDAIGRLAARSGLPVYVKGVLRADDARRCVDAGAAGVIVSNHGGRQLDRAVASAHALPAVAEAVGGRVPVLVDGGIRDGVDVLTALALGARAVLVGRPVLWALAVGGAQGVTALLEGYRRGLAEAMALCGAARLEQVTGDLVA